MKKQFTLIKNDNHIMKLPHNNKNFHSIFNNSNIKLIKHHENYQTHLNKNESNNSLKKNFILKERTLDLKARNKKLRSALESANIMAHNLKSPLMALNLLLNSNDINDSNKSIINLALNKISKTVDEIQLLDTACEASQSRVNIHKVEINAVIKECFNEVQSIYERDKNVSFKLNITNNSLETRLCTKSFKDAFYNIIKNSYEAIEYQGLIEVSVKTHGEKIEVRISDTGKGIPAHLINSIGNKQITYGKRGGTGIGVYHAKKVIEKIDGELRLRSIPNLGTQVSIFLPHSNCYS